MKYLKDLVVSEVLVLRPGYAVLKLTADEALPAMLPGQFVELRVTDSPNTFLRRPISINYVDTDRNELWLLVHGVGDGTRRLIASAPGERISCLFPLGNGFPMPALGSAARRVLLVGGGVGTAPLLYYGEMLRREGHEPVFLLGGRSASDIMQTELFEKIGALHLTTEDGSAGTKGFVTNHAVLAGDFDMIAMCGPKPMMQAVARAVKGRDIPCYASLENMMACGLGACLCCVEGTKNGNVCVCTEGPVFDVEQLNW